MIVQLGPVPCQGCGLPVVWAAHHWRAPRAIHVCPGARCGAWMRQARERCARKAGHGWEHRTRYAMDCNRVRRAA